MTVSLAGELSIRPVRAARPEELTAECAIVNTGDEAVELDPAPLSSPSLCLEIVDSAGARVLLPPPPVPGGALVLRRIEPGERYAVEHAAFLPAWTARGRFRARVRYVSGPRPGVEKWDGELFSPWSEFEVTGS